MTTLPWCPSFVVGAQNFVLTYPVMRWIPGERTTGSKAKDATGVPGVEVRLRRYTLRMQLRFIDEEWATVRQLIKLTQSGREFIWHPNALMTVPDMPDAFTVTLDAPRVRDAVTPTRDSQFLHLLTLPITLASETVFHAYYFPVT